MRNSLQVATQQSKARHHAREYKRTHITHALLNAWQVDTQHMVHMGQGLGRYVGGRAEPALVKPRLHISYHYMMMRYSEVHSTCWRVYKPAKACKSVYG